MEELFSVRFTIGDGVLPYTVTLTRRSGGYSETLNLSPDGTYEFTNVPVGTYDLNAFDSNTGALTTIVNVGN